MKILIIGATGLLAKPVIEALKNNGFQLRLLARSIEKQNYGSDIEIIQGDLFNTNILEAAIDGCDGVHITIAGKEEALATELIVKYAKQYKVKTISKVSGCTVLEENRWYDMINDKFKSENIIKESGIPYLIFKPTWFYDTLEKFVRDGKAAVFGKNKHLYHWLAATDFGEMVANAYRNATMRNEMFYLYGSEEYRFDEILNKYCKLFHPDIKKISILPIPLMKLIASLTKNNQLKEAVKMFAYFKKTPEPPLTGHADLLLGRSGMSFKEWCERK